MVLSSKGSISGCGDPLKAQALKNVSSPESRQNKRKECCQTRQRFHKLLINLQGHRSGRIRYTDALAKDQGLKLCYVASEMQGGLGKIMISGCLLEQWEPVPISPFLRV